MSGAQDLREDADREQALRDSEAAKSEDEKLKRYIRKLKLKFVLELNDKEANLAAAQRLQNPEVERLADILSTLYQETLGYATFDAEMIIEQVIFCRMDKEDETTELARTKHPFIAAAIVMGGRPTNRYWITINPVSGR